MYPEKKGGSHKMARPQQNWGLLTLLTRWASIWTMPNTASPKSEPPCGRAVYTPVRATILGHPPQKTAPRGEIKRKNLLKSTCPTGSFTCSGPWETASPEVSLFSGIFYNKQQILWLTQQNQRWWNLTFYLYSYFVRWTTNKETK